MARGGSRGRRTSYVRDNSGRFASTPGGGPPKRSTPASRRAARAKVTGGTLGARGSLRRSRAKLAGKNPADRSLQGTLSLRAQRGAVTRGANRLGKVRAASTVRMAGKGPAGVIRGGRKVAGKPVASAPPKDYRRGRSAAAGYKPKTDRTRASSQVGTRGWLGDGQRARAQTAKRRFGVRSTAQRARMRAGSYDPAKQGGGRQVFRTKAEARQAYLKRAAATKSTASKSYNDGRYVGDGVKTGTKGSARIRTAAVAQGNLLSGKADNVKVRKVRSLSGRSALGGAMRREGSGKKPGAIAARKEKPVAPKSIASQKAELEKILYNGSNSREARMAARDRIFKLDPSYSIQAGRTSYPPRPLSAAEKEANDREQRRKGFLASMPPMQRAKANAALEKSTVNNGNGVYRQALIEDRVNKGYKVQIQNGKRRLVGPDGAYFEQSALTKTGLDYADYLAKSARSTPRKPSPKGAGPRMKAARPAGTVAKPRGLKPGAIAGRKAAKAAVAKPAKAKAPSGPKINGKEWASLSRLRGAVPFDRGRGQTGYFIPGSSLTPAKRNKLGLGAFKSEVSGGNFTAQRHTQGSQEGWIISPRTQRGETPVQIQRSKSSRKPKTASDLLTQATRIEAVGRRMSRAARTGVRDRQIEARAVRAAKAARQRAFDMQKPPSKAELKRQEQRLNSPTTTGLNARLARDYAARGRR